MKSPPFSNELHQVLLQWDDSDDTSRAASKARLDALGADILPELAAAAAYVQRRQRVAGGIMLGAAATAYALIMGVLTVLPHGRNDPMPSWFLWFLLGCLAMVFGGIGLGSILLPNKLAIGLIHALSTLPASQGLALLLQVPSTGGSSSYRLQTVRYQTLVAVLNRVAEADAPALTPKERRCLYAMLYPRSSELPCATLQALTAMQDEAALPRVRRLMKQTRDWEIQEATNDYLRRFAPEEVTIHHRLSVETSDLLEVSDPSETTSVHIAPILACVMRLGSRNPAEQQAAENALRAMQSEELAQILLLLDQELPSDKRISRAIVATITAIGALLGSLIYFWALHWKYFDERMASSVAFAGAFAGGAVGWGKGLNIAYARRNRRRAQTLGSKGGVFPEKRLLDVLVSLENPALISTILDHLPPPNAIFAESMRQTLRASLQNLLPRLRASDTHLLSEQHRNMLNHELQRSQFKLSENWAGSSAEQQADFDVAILKAWEQVGDEHALPLVQQLANMAAKSPVKKRVKEAAEQCLPYLEVRVGEQRQTQTLLRASDVPTEAGEVLLRAATAYTAPAEAEQLLRAGIRNNHEDTTI